MDFDLNTPVEEFKNKILKKNITYPLLEYKDKDLNDLFKNSKINAPSGRILHV